MRGWYRRRHVLVAILCPALALAGCATTVPYTGVGPHPQIERGAPVPPIDFLGNLLALLGKLILWDWRFDNHYISPETEAVLVEYLESRDLPLMKDATFRLNQYAPGGDLSNLLHNHYVAWPYRVLLGLPITLVTDVLLPGRLFPWGDYYNPFTNTVHLYSDHPAISLHEAGHVHDFSTRKWKGTYATIRLIPFVDLYQEYKATDETIDYLRQADKREIEFSAYKILYPAFGSYVGQYMIFPGLNIVPILIGHIWGRATVHDRKRFYERLDASGVSAPYDVTVPVHEHKPASSGAVSHAPATTP